MKKPENLPEFKDQEEFESYLVFLKDVVNAKESSEEDIYMALEHLKFIDHTMKSGAPIKDLLLKEETSQTPIVDTSKKPNIRFTDEKIINLKIEINKIQDVNDFINSL